FVQLCLEGYYDNTIFHRLVPGFIIQGGDPTGKGNGGESIYGRPFENEFHSRLKFNRRGLLGMASLNENENTSQFFFTLGETSELTKKNTLFGRIVGDSIYNLLRMSEIELEGERPVYPPIIQKVEVLDHPFDDIQVRELKKEPTINEKSTSENKRKTMAKKNKNLLSFGEEEMIVAKDVKMKSLHDSIKNDPKIRPETSIDLNHTKKDIKAINTEIHPSPPQRNVDNIPTGNDNLSKQNDDQKLKIGKATEEKEEDKQNQINETSQKKVECLLHNIPNCESCQDSFGEKIEETDEGWLAHKLKFDKSLGYKDARDDPSELVVIDPRKKAEEILGKKKLKK
ncbi:cyclophilin-like protein, partial [Rozella allomycis CSF55]